MLHHTHNLTDDSGTEKLAFCRCTNCENAWWVRAASEHQPSFCCYCGMKFLWYDVGGNNYNIAGKPVL